MLVFAFLIPANLVSTLLECGVSQCQDNPVSYDWITKISAWVTGVGK
jgi:hypothetical protein